MRHEAPLLIGFTFIAADHPVINPVPVAIDAEHPRGDMDVLFPSHRSGCFGSITLNEWQNSHCEDGIIRGTLNRTRPGASMREELYVTVGGSSSDFSGGRQSKDHSRPAFRRRIPEPSQPLLAAAAQRKFCRMTCTPYSA